VVIDKLQDKKTGLCRSIQALVVRCHAIWQGAPFVFMGPKIDLDTKLI
jgi:hypothetical protein